MNKYNCDSLKNLPVPDRLIEKALAIPETAEKTPAVLPWYRQTRMIAAAASIVLVTVLGFTLYFLFRNIDPPVRPVVPVGSSDSTASLTDSTTAADGITATDATEDTTKHPSEKASEKPSEKLRDKPTENVSVSPTSPTGTGTATSPTENGSVVPSTQAPTSRATQVPVTPTQKPAEKPTQKPVQKPTVKPTEKPVVPTETPTVPESIPPTDEPTTTEGEAWLFLTSVSVNDISFTGDIYCRVYDCQTGRMMGESDIFDWTHRAEWNYNRPRTRITLSFFESVTSGEYEAVFYDSTGAELTRYIQTVDF